MGSESFKYYVLVMGSFEERVMCITVAHRLLGFLNPWTIIITETATQSVAITYPIPYL